MEPERLDRARTAGSIAAVTASGRPPWASAVLVRYPPRAVGLAAGAAVGLLGAPAGGHGELVFPTVDSAGRSVGPGWRNRPCVAGIGIVPAGGHPAWTGTNGPHLDRIVDSKEHMEGALSELREVIGEDDKELAEREARELRRQRSRHLDGPGSHWMMALRRTRRGPCPPAPRLYERYFPASAAPSATSSADRTSMIGCGPRPSRGVLERSKELKRDWNRQVERAAEEGVHVIYTDGYDRQSGRSSGHSHCHYQGYRREGRSVQLSLPSSADVDAQGR